MLTIVCCSSRVLACFGRLRLQLIDRPELMILIMKLSVVCCRLFPVGLCALVREIRESRGLARIGAAK